MQQTIVQKYLFISTETYQILKCMKDIHMNKVQPVQCVQQCLELIKLKIYTQGRR